MCQSQGRAERQSAHETEVGDVHPGNNVSRQRLSETVTSPVQGKMSEHAQKLILYHEELRRLSRRLEVMEQLHLAPSIYLATLVEVVRRRSFSQQYLKKAGLIAGTFGEVHAEELRTRQIFQEKLNRHFLSSMFQVVPLAN